MKLPEEGGTFGRHLDSMDKVVFAHAAQAEGANHLEPEPDAVAFERRNDAPQPLDRLPKVRVEREGRSTRPRLAPRQ